MKKDFLSVCDLSRSEIEELFAITDLLKRTSAFKPLHGKSAALIFQKPSLRTRVSFEVGIQQLGGHPIFLSQEGIGVGEREKASDVARLLSRYTGIIIARVFEHETLLELAENASVPVVNALTNLSHPCQVLADAYTIRQANKLHPGFKLAFIGDGNNIVNSWLEFTTLFPMHFTLAVPDGYHPDKSILKQAKSIGKSVIEIVKDPKVAAQDADVLYTDVWISMGQETEEMVRRKAFKGYQVNDKMLAVAKKDCVVMHCLPAHRGEEITERVMEGPQSIIFDQAENRLHVQKAIMAKLLGFKLDGKPSGESQGSLLVKTTSV